MTDEQIENIFVSRSATKDVLPKEVLAEILDYKARNIKTHIPAIIFKQASDMLKLTDV